MNSEVETKRYNPVLDWKSDGPYFANMKEDVAGDYLKISDIIGDPVNYCDKSDGTTCLFYFAYDTHNGIGYHQCSVSGEDCKGYEKLTCPFKQSTWSSYEI